MFVSAVHRGVAPPSGPDPDFVADIETTAPDESFTWLFSSSGTYNAVIDYGDSSPTQTITSSTDSNRTHTYSVANTYTVRISGQLGGFVFNGAGDYLKIKRIRSFGDDVFDGSFDQAFNFCANIISMDGGNIPRVGNFRRAFKDNTSLIEAYFASLGSGNMTSLFANNSNMTIASVGDLSNASGLSYAFQDCSKLTSVLITALGNGGHDRMFSGCTLLPSVPKLDWSNATTFRETFLDCSAMTEFDAFGMGTGEMRQTFQNCSSLHTIHPMDLSGGTTFQSFARNTVLANFPANAFDTTSATNFSSAFVNCALTQQSVDNILVSVDIAGQSNGTLNMDGGTSAAPGAAGLTAKANLESRGWTVSTN